MATGNSATRRLYITTGIATGSGPDPVPGEERILAEDRVTLGRSSACQLCFPDDIGISRQHLSLTCDGQQWWVEDLGSKNGTLVNDTVIDRPTRVGPADQIRAGHVTLQFRDGESRQHNYGVEFVDQPDSNLLTPDRRDTSTTTEVADLDMVLGESQIGVQSVFGLSKTDLNKTNVFQGNPQVRALIRAGRELAGHRPLNELFEVIMDLSMEAVFAGRGVLMTLVDQKGEDQLEVRAARGAGFKISSTVRDRVIKDKTSLLVRDAQMDQALREQKSIVMQKVRSFIAVPLQTQDRVIGLIYVDSPDLIREFTREDLGLLTVMANVAAIRIEHARLNEVEATERILAQELDQAAQIQMALLPTVAPQIQGLDIAGRTLASRTVGGDYYDYLNFPDGRFGMIVGDVAGKGLPASLLMSSLQARVQVLFEDGEQLAEKITRLNKATAANCPDNRFITFFMTVMDPATGKLIFCNAGHNPPILVRASGGSTSLSGDKIGGGFMLGIFAGAKYTQAEEVMQPGDVLVLFSDGVTEAADPTDQEFGEARLLALVESLKDRPAAEIVDAIHANVAQFAEGAPQADDITVVVARRV